MSYLVYVATPCVLHIQSDCDVVNIWGVWVRVLVPQSHQQPVFTGKVVELDSLQRCCAAFGVAHLFAVITYARHRHDSALCVWPNFLNELN